MNERPENQRLVFVVYKHQETTLHVDFRLQIGSVMRTFAIPKGSSADLTSQTIGDAQQCRNPSSPC